MREHTMVAEVPASDRRRPDAGPAAGPPTEERREPRERPPRERALSAGRSALSAVRRRTRRATLDTGVGTVVGVSTMPSLALFLVTAYFVILFVIGIGAVALPICIPAVRWLCNRARRVAGWTGVQVEVPYQPEPAEIERDIVGWMRRCKWILTDRATWRDLLWLLLNTAVGMIGFLPAALLYYAGEGLVLAGGLWQSLLSDNGTGRMYCGIVVDSHPTAVAAGFLAVGVFGLWLWTTPFVLRGYAYFTRYLLGHTDTTRLASRVRHLAESRSGALDTQAAELRRIERDLHDGAQARLVGLGMTLGAADRHLDKDTDEARRLLREARASSVIALRELRDLVRGIHPPVLAERGLADALRALCIASPLPFEVSVTIPPQLSAPVESAVYFSVSELLTNVLKHAGASRGELTVRYERGVLLAQVTDNGRGGASMSDGTGLAGIRRRLAAFDGTIDISSPPGGPTVTELEIPCASSSPRTFSS
ncbi:sensor histidine kinase [Streptomyces niveus]|uniref:sensor histidine kinase n=1 Tax=Streptomyces niveus TaxID=193462 RepID=UPI00369FB18E